MPKFDITNKAFRKFIMDTGTLQTAEAKAVHEAVGKYERAGFFSKLFGIGAAKEAKKEFNEIQNIQEGLRTAGFDFDEKGNVSKKAVEAQGQAPEVQKGARAAAGPAIGPQPNSYKGHNNQDIQYGKLGPDTQPNSPQNSQYQSVAAVNSKSPNHQSFAEARAMQERGSGAAAVTQQPKKKYFGDIREVQAIYAENLAAQKKSQSVQYGSLPERGASRDSAVISDKQVLGMRAVLYEGKTEKEVAQAMSSANKGAGAAAGPAIGPAAQKESQSVQYGSLSEVSPSSNLTPTRTPTEGETLVSKLRATIYSGNKGNGGGRSM